MVDLNLVAAVALDAYLLARYAPPGGDLPDGRAWERVVGELLWRPGLDRRQYAGNTALFGRNSLSGCRHEFDACASGWHSQLIVECKAKRHGVDKADVAVFHLKMFDYYWGNPDAVCEERWWPMLVAAGSVAEDMRRLCLQLGIVLCDQEWLPIPVLLRTATKPLAGRYIASTTLDELVRLGGSACRPLQEWWCWNLPGVPHCRSSWLSQRDMDGLLRLQRELSGALLDLYDLYRPGLLEQRAERLRARLQVAAYA